MSAELLRRAAEQARETAANLRAISQALTDMFDDGDQGSLQNSRIHDAVADWLNACALVCEVKKDAVKGHALAVARAYLGEAS